MHLLPFLVLKCGLSLSDIDRLTLRQLEVLLDGTASDTITFRDEREYRRWLESQR